MLAAMPGRVLLVIVVGVLLTSGCLASGVERPWHHATHVSTVPPPVDPTSPGYGKPLAFPDYVTWARGQIQKARASAGYGGDAEEAIVDMRAPFQWEPDPAACAAAVRERRRGILLIHGLTDSPFLMRDIGRHFQARCFLV